MRLVIDCFKLVKGIGKSIGIYNVALSLIQNLVVEKNNTVCKEIKNCEIIVLGNKFNRDDFCINGVQFIQINKYDPLRKFHCLIWENIAVSRVCKKLRADKILFPRGYCALTHPIEDIIIIHDMIPFFYNENYPNVFNKYENKYIMKRLKLSAKHAKKIITISESSKADIIKYCKINENKIIVIYNACNAIKFHEKKEEQSVPYICTMTSNLPHKNAKGIIEGYVKYYNESDSPLNLVIIGIESVKEYEISDEVLAHIKCYKYIQNNTDVYRIINNSEMFLFLSLVEGFGLPPIEAMQLNVPVICSNVSSLPEVVGNAALLVNPTDERDISNAINKIQHDDLLKKDLIIKGRKNLERFTCDTRAKMYWNAIMSE